MGCYGGESQASITINLHMHVSCACMRKNECMPVKLRVSFHPGFHNQHMSCSVMNYNYCNIDFAFKLLPLKYMHT